MMKPYVVEARLAYEVPADTADEVLRLVSLMILDRRALSVEYSVREQPEPVATPKEPQPADLHGLTKLVYTVSETASLLGTSRSTVRQRFGSISVRLGRRVLIYLLRSHGEDRTAAITAACRIAA
jgi:hypothetical protein